METQAQRRACTRPTHRRSILDKHGTPHEPITTDEVLHFSVGSVCIAIAITVGIMMQCMTNNTHDARRVRTRCPRCEREIEETSRGGE